MTDQNKKPQNEWKRPDWTVGSERPQEKSKSKSPVENNRKDGYKTASGKREPGSAGTGNKRSQRANTGWLFYKDYYHGIPFHPGQKKNEFKTLFEAKNVVILSRQLSQYHYEVEALKLNYKTIQCFEMTTAYPGLATGLGSPHESHQEGEFKLGFHFDHTTGLPVIPGSSVKGVLRSAFKKSPEYIRYLLENLTKKKISIPDINSLEKEIFDGEGLPPYKRDVFLDAVIIASKNESTAFLADDFITPHGNNVFKEPVPLQFLKILPQVTFRFQFRLQEGLISGQDKLKLFEKIIEDLGIGAKTNVGYGKFSKSD